MHVAAKDRKPSKKINCIGWNKPLPLALLYIEAHRAVPSPDRRMFAASGRGSSNIYLIDTLEKRVIGNRPNPAAGPTTVSERLSSGLLIGLEPHEPTFSRNGNQVWFSHKLVDSVFCRSTLSFSLAITRMLAITTTDNQQACGGMRWTSIRTPKRNVRRGMT